MAVTFDNTKESAGVGITTLSVTLTIGADLDRAGMATLAFGTAGVSNVTVSGAGGTWALVSGTDTGNALAPRTMIFAASGLRSGSQTITASWTTASDANLGVVTASVVNQSIPANNGTSNHPVTGTHDALAITTTSGDMTIDIASINQTLSAPTQTQNWIDNVTLNSGSSRAVASGTSNSHDWTASMSTAWAHSGANFQQASSIPVFIQQAKSITAASTTVLVTLSASPLNTNCLVCWATQSASTAVTTITGGGVPSWILGSPSAGSLAEDIWIGANSNGSSTTVLITFNASGDGCGIVAEFSLVRTTSVIDVANVNLRVQTSTSGIVTTNLTTLNSNDLVLAGGYLFNTTSITSMGSSSAGWTDTTSAITASQIIGMIGAYQIVAATGNFSDAWSPTATGGATMEGDGAIMALQAARLVRLGIDDEYGFRIKPAQFAILLS